MGNFIQLHHYHISVRVDSCTSKHTRAPEDKTANMEEIEVAAFGLVGSRNGSLCRLASAQGGEEDTDSYQRSFGPAPFSISILPFRYSLLPILRISLLH